MDRRQKKTREAIFRAFTELLKHEPYSKITVQEIIDLADIGRTTFYAHFETKDDLLRSVCSDIFEHVFSEDLHKESTHDFSGSKDTKAKITHILYHLKEHMDYLPGILSGESGEIFMSYFKDYLKELFTRSGVTAAGKAPKEYVLNHMVCDLAETVKWWTLNTKYSPEEVSSFFIETTPLM
ncbi:MAG: TetR/AcrR family transcriptional regulator [Succinivibrionaceae bacterium]|nr:TetR/AcrR family transcriptional regulator [Succinivibrionaceae bacterium]